MPQMSDSNSDSPTILNNQSEYHKQNGTLKRKAKNINQESYLHDQSSMSSDPTLVGSDNNRHTSHNQGNGFYYHQNYNGQRNHSLADYPSTSSEIDSSYNSSSHNLHYSGHGNSGYPSSNWDFTGQKNNQNFHPQVSHNHNNQHAQIKRQPEDECQPGYYWSKSGKRCPQTGFMTLEKEHPTSKLCIKQGPELEYRARYISDQSHQLLRGEEGGNTYPKLELQNFPLPNNQPVNLYINIFCVTADSTDKCIVEHPYYRPTITQTKQVIDDSFFYNNRIGSCDLERFVSDANNKKCYYAQLSKWSLPSMSARHDDWSKEYKGIDKPTSNSEDGNSQSKSHSRWPLHVDFLQIKRNTKKEVEKDLPQADPQPSKKKEIDERVKLLFEVKLQDPNNPNQGPSQLLGRALTEKPINCAYKEGPPKIKKVYSSLLFTDDKGAKWPATSLDDPSENNIEFDRTVTMNGQHFLRKDKKGSELIIEELDYDPHCGYPKFSEKLKMIEHKSDTISFIAPNYYDKTKRPSFKYPNEYGRITEPVKCQISIKQGVDRTDHWTFYYLPGPTQPFVFKKKTHMSGQNFMPNAYQPTNNTMVQDNQSVMSHHPQNRQRNHSGYQDSRAQSTSIVKEELFSSINNGPSNAKKSRINSQSLERRKAPSNSGSEGGMRPISRNGRPHATIENNINIVLDQNSNNQSHYHQTNNNIRGNSQSNHLSSNRGYIGSNQTNGYSSSTGELSEKLRNTNIESQNYQPHVSMKNDISDNPRMPILSPAPNYNYNNQNFINQTNNFHQSRPTPNPGSSNNSNIAQCSSASRPNTDFESDHGPMNTNNYGGTGNYRQRFEQSSPSNMGQASDHEFSYLSPGQGTHNPQLVNNNINIFQNPRANSVDQGPHIFTRRETDRNYQYNINHQKTNECFQNICHKYMGNQENNVFIENRPIWPGDQYGTETNVPGNQMNTRNPNNNAYNQEYPSNSRLNYENSK